MTRKNIHNHIKKHFLEKPELKERYFVDNYNEDQVGSAPKVPAIITPLERYMGFTVNDKMMKDIWDQHKALMKLGNLLRWNQKAKQALFHELMEEDWRATPTRILRSNQKSNKGDN